MIDTLLKIIGRLEELGKARARGRTSTFDSVYKPTFDDLLLIHGDYVGIFERLRQYALEHRALDEPALIADIKARLRDKRIEFEPIRAAVRELATALDGQNLAADEREFVDAVIRYFPSGESSERQSVVTSVLDELEDDLTAVQLDQLLLKTVQRQRNAWSDICAAFARLEVGVATEPVGTLSGDQLIRDSAVVVTVSSVVLYLWGYTFEAFRPLNRSAPGIFLPDVPHQDRILVGGLIAIFVMLPAFLAAIAVDALVGRYLHRHIVGLWNRDLFHRGVLMIVLLATTIVPVRVVSQLTERYTNNLKVVSITMKGSAASLVQAGYYCLGKRDDSYVFADNIGAANTRLHVVRADEIAELVLAYSGQRSVAGDLRVLSAKLFPSVSR